MTDYALPHLEWEVLQNPITIEKVNPSDKLPEGIKKIEIERDEFYKINAKIIGEGRFAPSLLEGKKTLPGSIGKTFPITGSDIHNHIQYTLGSCYLSRERRTYNANGSAFFKIDLITQNLKIKYESDKDVASLTEWYINGPRDKFIFKNMTEREMSKTFTRKRSVSPNEEIHFQKFFGGTSKNLSRDCLKIEACDNKFLITQVPKGIGPEWSSSVGIEYRKEWGSIPDPEEREKICEISNFIFGRRLLPVGHSIYDEDGYAIEEYAHNAWGDNPKKLCSTPDQAPVRIDTHAVWGKAEDLINQLLPTYLNLCGPLRLKEALWLYWFSSNMPLEINLPILSSAFETIMNRWFQYSETKTRGVLIKKDKFEELLQEELKSAQNKLDGQLYKNRIMKHLKNAYRMGVKERFEFFFEEIGLEINDDEWKAIEARHPPAHGRIDFGSNDWIKQFRYKQTYETLFNKTILKLLGYSGTYVDYSTPGFPEKKLIEK